MGLHSVSDESRRLIYNAAAEAFNCADQQVEATAWKKMAKQFHQDIFIPVEMKGVVAEEPVYFYMADFRKLLPHVIESCPNYAALIQAELQNQPNLAFSLVLYNDEATGGNILQPDSKKKMSLWYFALKEISWQWSDIVWHPFCAVQHVDFDKVKGNFSAIAKQIILNLLDQDLHMGIPVALPNGSNLLRCVIRFMISDLDSIRAAMSLKGSSAIRCCVFCRNAIKKNSGIEDYNDYFQDIASHNFEVFEDQTDGDVFDAIDELARQQPRLRKGAMKRKEVASGFNFNPDGLLSSTLAREALPPSAFLLDPMHIYWSNGICSWEINAIYDLWKETGSGNLDAFLQLEWKTSATTNCSRSWRCSLGHISNFAGDAYKGSASNLQCFLPLFHYFLEGCLTHGELEPQKESLRALRRVIIEFRTLPHQQRIGTERLQHLQKLHQQKVLEAYGMPHMKPKHHARHHLALQMERFQYYVDCFPMEKHTLYKSHIGLHRFDPWADGDRKKKGQFSFLILQQMWQHHVKALSKFSFTTSLIGKTQDDFNLAQLLGVGTVKVSNKIYHRGKTIGSGTVLLGEHPGVVKCALQNANDFYLLVDIMQIERQSEFHSTWKTDGRTKLVPVDQVGRSPVWWLQLGNKSWMCLH